MYARFELTPQQKAKKKQARKERAIKEKHILDSQLAKNPQLIKVKSNIFNGTTYFWNKMNRELYGSQFGKPLVKVSDPNIYKMIITLNGL